jgi:hypothetical protein
MPQNGSGGSGARLASVIDKQILGFVQPDITELSARLSEPGLEAPPHFNYDIFRSRNHMLKRGDFLIEEAMVHRLHHFLIHDFLQDFEVEYHPCYRIGRTFHCHLDYVVMPMAVRIGVGAIDAAVFFVAPRRIPADVGSGKLGFASEKHRPSSIDEAAAWRILEKASSRSSKIIA